MMNSLPADAQNACVFIFIIDKSGLRTLWEAAVGMMLVPASVYRP